MAFEGRRGLHSKAYAAPLAGTFSKFNSTDFPFPNVALRGYYSTDINAHIGIYDTHLSLTDSGVDIHDLRDTITIYYFRRVVIQFLSNLLIAWLFIIRLSKLKSPHLLNYYQLSFSKVGSTFQFLRYSGPRRLRSSRRVIVDNDEYQVAHVGRGAFATVSRVLHKPSGEMRVMKRIVFDNGGLAESLAQAEVDSLRAVMGSIWFPPVLNHFMDEEEYIITMPFYHRGDMAALIKHKGYLGSGLARFYCAQLILAIQSLHQQGIIHRDIKPDNIFLDESGHLILADLGLAENIGTFDGSEQDMAKFPGWLEAKNRGGDDYPLLWVDGANPLGTREMAGTLWYTAPEVFRSERYSFGVDYYSVGVIYYELVTSHLPFNTFIPYPEDKRPMVDFRRKPGQVKSLEPFEKESILKILASCPSHRPQTVGELKQNILFAGIDWEKMSSRSLPPPPLPAPLLEG